MSTKTKKPRLGRGLSSLLSTSVGVVPDSVEASAAAPKPSQDSPFAWVAVADIDPNPFQPRQTFNPDRLNELANSIRQDGVMQPIVVRESEPGAGRYQIVAGERRWRAAELAGLDRVPAVVRSLDDKQLAEWAVIENLQREDLDVIEQAHAFARLAEQFNLTHEQIAERVGINRSTVSNTLRLLHLPDEIQSYLRDGILTQGHVRPLIALSDDIARQVALARLAVKEAWSVRKLESAAKTGGAASTANGEKTPSRRSAHLTDLARQVGEQIGTKVQIKPGKEKGAGRLVIDFYDLDQFDALLTRMGVKLD